MIKAMTITDSELNEPSDKIGTDSSYQFGDEGPGQCLEMGLSHLRDLQFSKAIILLTEALRNESGKIAALRGLASAYVAIEKMDTAREVIRSFVSDNPMSDEGWRLLSLLEWKQGDRARAIEVLEQGISQIPGSDGLRKQMAIYHGMPWQAADSKAEPQIGLAELAAGWINGDSETEIENATAELSMARFDDSESTMHIAGTDETSCDWDDWLDQIARNPKLLEAMLRVDQPLARTTISADRDEMLQQLEIRIARTIAQQPNHADRFYMLATVQVARNDFASAEHTLTNALERNSKMAKAVQLLATVQKQQGKIQEAIDTLKSLGHRGAAWPDIHLEIAQLHDQLGQRVEAKSHLQSAIRINPQYKQASQMLSRVAA